MKIDTDTRNDWIAVYTLLGYFIVIFLIVLANRFQGADNLIQTPIPTPILEIQ